MLGVDATAKRYFPAIICGLIAVIAYLQGRGVASLIAEQLPGSGPTESHRASLLPAIGRTTRDISARPILDRNPFDSVTGPLTGLPPPPEPPSEGPKDLSDAPPCTSGAVVLITESADPAFSFAVLKNGTGTQLRRVGDDVDGKKVEAIDWDRIWLGSSNDRCHLKLGASIGAVGAKGSAPAPRAERVTPPKAGAEAPSAAGIRQVGETEYVIERSASDKVKALEQAFMKGARVVDGKGVRLQRSAQTTVLGQLGLKKGDLVKTINGFDMTVPDQAVEAYGKLKTAPSIQIVLERNGKPMTYDYKVE